MKITVKQLTFKNFKGIKSLEVPLNPGINTISGRNATGKTSIFDGYLWNLFGKDSDDRTDFNVKTLKPDGTPNHFLEHESEVTLQVDDQIVTLKRILREKWTKPRGQSEQQFSGHETTFFVNDVPCQLREYNLKVDSICNAETFKLLSDPLYFSMMQWTKQREILFKMAGEVTEEDMPMSKGMRELIDRLNGKAIKDYQREIAAKRLKAKEEIELIPARIDEVTMSIPAAVDYPVIEKEIAAKQAELNKIDETIADVAKQVQGAGAKTREIQEQINILKSRQQQIEFEVKTESNKSGEEAKAEYQRLKNTISIKSQTLADLNQSILNEGANLTKLNEKRMQLVSDWHKVNDEQIAFDEEQFVCPTCKRPYEAHDIEKQKETLTSNFNTDKAGRLTKITNEGLSVKEGIEKKGAQIQEYRNQVAGLETEINALKTQRDEAEKKIPAAVVSISPLLEKHEEYQANALKITELTHSLIGVVAPSVTDYQEGKKVLTEAIDNLKTQLHTKDQIEKGNARIEELKRRQEVLAQEITNYEKDEFTILDYTKAKIKATEERINKMFSVARFKMFNIQVNGQEDPTCECMVNGVPFRDLNNGMKIAVGIDIINTLSKHFNTYAPVFIDNAEAINVIPETKSQLICLVVTDTQLMINGQAKLTEKHKHEPITA